MGTGAKEMKLPSLTVKQVLRVARHALQLNADCAHAEGRPEMARIFEHVISETERHLIAFGDRPQIDFESQEHARKRYSIPVPASTRWTAWSIEHFHSDPVLRSLASGEVNVLSGTFPKQLRLLLDRFDKHLRHVNRFQNLSEKRTLEPKSTKQRKQIRQRNERSK